MLLISPLFTAFRCARFTLQMVCSLISAVFNWLYSRLPRLLRQLWTNRWIQASILSTFRNQYVLNSLSNSSRLGLNVFNAWTLRMHFDSSFASSGLGSGMISGGHSVFSLNRLGPHCHNLLLVMSPPRLPRSAGFWSFGT